MSKEMQLLSSKIQFYKRLINVYDELNFVSKSNKFDYKIKEYQDILLVLYRRVQELKEEENNARTNNNLL